MNIWISYIWTAENNYELDGKKIISVIGTTFAVVKKKNLKKKIEKIESKKYI